MENDDKKPKTDVTQNKSADVGTPAKNAAASDLSREAWDKAKQPWHSTLQGRVAIRTLSRGILGAGFFVTGQLLYKKWMHSHYYLPYQPSYSFKAQIIGENVTNAEGVVEKYRGNILKVVAKTIDETVSKPIQAVAEYFKGETWAHKFVSFRPTEYIGYSRSAGDFHNIRGRSLGDEAVGITFDFFMASIGDALGRDLVDLLDPNIKSKPWRDEDGHFNPVKAVKVASKSLWRYVSYNGGEDIAVAIPYAFFMKGQRALINKVSPGFAYDFDQGLNGNSFKVDTTGKIVGHYYAQGAFDLQSRFTAYNIGTLMYRELYDKLEHAWNGKHVSLYGDPDKIDPNKGIVEKTGDVMKWAARSAIKGVIYMTPSVPFFWITRASQSKNRGLAICQDIEIQDSHGKIHRGAAKMSQLKEDGTRKGVNYNLFWDAKRGEHIEGMDKSKVYFAQYNPDYVSKIEDAFHRSTEYQTDTIHPSFQKQKPFKTEEGKGWFGKTMGVIGRLNYDASQKMDGLADYVDKRAKQEGSILRSLKDGLGLGEMPDRLGRSSKLLSFDRFTSPAFNAAVSYTPYMIAKAEFANKIDTGQMDLAAERLIDGAASLNWSEFKAGAGEVWRSILQKPLEDPVRAAEAERRKARDTSAADSAYEGQKDDDARKFADKARKKHDSDTAAKRSSLSWQEKMHSRSDDDSNHVISTKHAPMSHAEREEMRQALERAQPPTNSLH